MKKIHSKHLLVALSALGLFSCSAHQTGPMIQEGEQTNGGVGNVISLEQGWTENTQQLYYFTTQGSRILPYDWYLNLEQAGNQTLFRDNGNMERLNYIPSQSNKWNPDGLAVGFVKDTDKKAKQDWMGFTCAACHTSQIRYGELEMRIDGGQTMADFETFNEDLVAAMSATYEDNAKFNRFANAVLGADHSPNDANKLRNDLLAQTEVLAQRNQINHPNPGQPDYGYGRVDAVGAIFNQILSKFNDMPNNGLISDAPVSYPFLWGTHQSDVVQWPGFAPNGPLSLGALTRNGGEVLGVYGQLDIPDNKKIKHYKSSLAVSNLGLLEQWVAQLRSPQWPVQYLPAPDPAKAAAGARHFDEYCASCHQVIPRGQEGKPYKSVLTPLKEVKTDPQELLNILKTRPAGKFEGRKEFVIAGDVIPAETTGLAPLVNSVVGSLFGKPLQAIEAAVWEFEGGVAAYKADDKNKTDSEFSGIEQLLHQMAAKKQEQQASGAPKSDDPADSPLAVYKARPLNGIWATAPYLHNGSVPNLWEILLPESERSKSFYLGSREFDPVNVGYVTAPDPASGNDFKFDTSLTGNGNGGHEYGVKELSKAEKWELLEYMKTL